MEKERATPGCQVLGMWRGFPTNKVLPGRGVKTLEFLCINVYKVGEIYGILVLGGLAMFDVIVS